MQRAAMRRRRETMREFSVKHTGQTWRGVQERKASTQDRNLAIHIFPELDLLNPWEAIS
jgi:hypothetical protein